MTKTILFVSLDGYRALPSGSALKIISGEASIQSVTDESSGLALIGSHAPFDIVVCNAPHGELFEAVRAKSSRTVTVLVTERPIRQYSDDLGQKEHLLVDHIIANRGATDWTTHQLRITLQKILTLDVFGIEKYLVPGTLVHRSKIRGSQDRDPHNNAVMQYAEDRHLGQYTAKMVFGITEELLMNAIYDAPIAAGIEEYTAKARTETFHLKPHEQGELSYACDDSLFIIAVSDPFGALNKNVLLSYIKKVLRRNDSTGLIDTKKGGAGLGFFKILYSSNALVCNVKPGEKTEIMAILDIREHLRDFAIMPRSIHYFTTDAA